MELWVLGAAGIPFREMPVEALPGLNIPRMSHSLFAVGDELVVIGGHTTGFIPTKTAEYLNGGRMALIGGAGGYSNYDPTPVACILSPDGPVRADGFFAGIEGQCHLGSGNGWVILYEASELFPPLPGAPAFTRH